jgi:hypothetical protein
MPTTYEPIATTSVSGTGTITFSSIPQTYTDLRLIVNTISTNSQQQYFIRYNSSTSGYSRTYLYGTGGGLAVGNQLSQTEIFTTGGVVNTTTTPTFHDINILNYTSAKWKTAILKCNNATNSGSNQVIHNVGLWRDTSAINRIDFSHSSTGTSTFIATLYGIKAA